MFRSAKYLAAIGASLFATSALALSGPYHSTFQASALELSHLAGQIEITVGGPGVSVSVTGQPEELAAVTVTNTGTVVRIESSQHRHDIFGDVRKLATYKISVPKGARLDLDKIIGGLDVGDVGGDLYLRGVAVEGHVGRMHSADVSLAGSGRLTIGDVEQDAKMSIAGSGNITASDANFVDVSIAGSGGIKFHVARTGLSVRISGSGDVAGEKSEGPLYVGIAGSGTVDVKDGHANPFKVKISGHGNVIFGGEGTDPDISISGSGGVKLGSMKGHLSKHGQGDIIIGK